MLHVSCGTVVRAYLIETIEYFKFGESIIIPAGQLILVDESHGVALIGDDQVEIAPNEYREVVYS